MSIAHRDNIHDIEDDIRQADILVVECVERLDDSLNGTILQLIDILEIMEKHLADISRSKGLHFPDTPHGNHV